MAARPDQLQVLGLHEGSKGGEFVSSRGGTEPVPGAKAFFSWVTERGKQHAVEKEEH